MDRVPNDERAEFPRARDLERWLATPEGRFAQYTAQAAVAADPVPQPGV